MRPKRPRVVRETIQNKLLFLFEKNPSITQSDLARYCGVTNTSVTRWLDGTSSIDIELIPMVCDFFNISVNELFGTSEVGQLTYKQRKIVEAYNGCSQQGQNFIYDQAMIALKNFPTEDDRSKSVQVPDIQVRTAATA